MKRLSRTQLIRSLSTLVGLTLVAASMFGQTVEEMRLTGGKSIVLDYPADVRQIFTPAIPLS